MVVVFAKCKITDFWAVAPVTLLREAPFMSSEAPSRPLRQRLKTASRISNDGQHGKPQNHPAKVPQPGQYFIADEFPKKKIRFRRSLSRAT